MQPTFIYHGVMAKMRIIARPHSSRDEVVVPPSSRDLITVRVKAPATDGKANSAVCRTLAQWAQVAPSTVVVTNGHTSRIKTIEFKTLDKPPTATASQEKAQKGKP